MTRASKREWSSDVVDVAAYFERIGYGGQPSTSVPALRALHRAHVDTVPFENVDVVLRRPIALDIAALQAKLIARRRGGYCYEHNLLFGALLERLGFEVTRLAARIRMGGDKVLPKSHMCLSVEAEGVRWLADVGFGAEGLLEPIPFDVDTIASQGAWTYRLAPDDSDGGWRLQSRHVDGWFDLYAFTDEPQHHVDYEVVNYYTSTNPGSPFVAGLVVQRGDEQVRRTLRGTELTTAGPGGVLDRRELADDELSGVLADTFGLSLPADDLARLHPSATTKGEEATS